MTDAEKALDEMHPWMPEEEYLIIRAALQRAAECEKVIDQYAETIRVQTEALNALKAQEKPILKELLDVIPATPLHEGMTRDPIADVKRLIAKANRQEKPVEVTVKEFNDLIDPLMPSFNNIGNLFLNKFPNGVKVVDGGEHG